MSDTSETIPDRIFTPHTGDATFGAHWFPDLPEGWIWRLDVGSWEADGVWWIPIQRYIPEPRETDHKTQPFPCGDPYDLRNWIQYDDDVGFTWDRGILKVMNISEQTVKHLLTLAEDTLYLNNEGEYDISWESVKEEWNKERERLLDIPE